MSSSSCVDYRWNDGNDDDVKNIITLNSTFSRLRETLNKLSRLVFENEGIDIEICLYF